MINNKLYIYEKIKKLLQKKAVGFEAISIRYIDRKTIAFLHRFFRHLSNQFGHRYDECLHFGVHFSQHLASFRENVHGLRLSARFFHRLRQIVPSILNECPSLGIVSLYGADFFTEFPCDDSAMASDGQVLAKWLFTPLQSNVPKMLECPLDLDDGILASKIEAFKAAFANASSPVNFIVVILFLLPSFAGSVSDPQ